MIISPGEGASLVVYGDEISKEQSTLSYLKPEGVVYILESARRLFLAHTRETDMRPAHRRTNPPPTIREAQGEGVVLLAHGEPHDPCPVASCRGSLLFLHR